MTSPLSYPDAGAPIGDRIVLRNAIVFTTAQRAYGARQILNTDLAGLHELERAFLAVEGFQQYVVSLEDLVGWLFVLRLEARGSRDESVRCS